MTLGDTKNGGGCFPILSRKSKSFLFAFLDTREVMPMYMTWETFLLFCSVTVAVIGLVVDIFHNKKK